MKSIAVVVLLCALAGVEPRYAAISQDTRAAAALGDNPWFVHIRLATATSGFLNTCAGSLISSNWILTTTSCLTGSRFIWNRYGVVDVISPSLVTESSTVRLHPNYNAQTGENDIGLISIGRNVQSTDNIGPVRLAAEGSDVPSSGTFCAFGADDAGNPGQNLNCNDYESLDDISATQFDSGAPLVADGVQYGLVTKAGDNTVVVNVADYLGWIQQQTGLSFGRSAEADEGLKVRFVDN